MAILTATLATLARRIFKACGCSLGQNCGRQFLQFVGYRRKLVPRISGGHTAGATPVPIPNTEVKPRRADDTARVTVWERRSLPGLKSPRAGAEKTNGPLILSVGRFRFYSLCRSHLMIGAPRRLTARRLTASSRAGLVQVRVRQKGSQVLFRHATD